MSRFEKVDCRTRKDTAKTYWRATVFRRYTLPAPSYLVSMTDSTCKYGAGGNRRRLHRKDRSSLGHERRMVPGRGFFKCVDFCPKLSSREVHHSVKRKSTNSEANFGLAKCPLLDWRVLSSFSFITQTSESSKSLTRKGRSIGPFGRCVWCACACPVKHWDTSEGKQNERRGSRTNVFFSCKDELI